MEEQWVAYLRENNPELYEQAVESIKWAAEWRDKQLAAAKAELAAEREKRETHPAYYWQQRCYQQSDSFQKDYACLKKVCQHEKKMREQAEAQCAAMRAVIEYLSMRYGLCVQISPNGAWQVENKKQASDFAALEDKP